MMRNASRPTKQWDAAASKAFAGVQKCENNSTPMETGSSAHKNGRPCELGYWNKGLNRHAITPLQGADRLGAGIIGHLAMVPIGMVSRLIRRQHTRRGMAVDRHLLDHHPLTADRALHSPTDCEGELAHDWLGVLTFSDRI